MQLDAPLAIVDLETTGGHPAHDRVTEIAVLEVDGFEVTAEWSTLVNPETTIPPAIQALTGITNDMVAGAPRFAQLAAGLYERLQGRVFVAHNARFDYGFLRREFERTGRTFRAKTLCTVRLSRRLYAEHAQHNLDAVIERHHLVCRERHRALGDADALWQFLRVAAEEHGPDILETAARQIARQPALPPHIDRAVLDAIPEAPGVYLFYGEAGTPLYVGKSINLHTRVVSHFTGGVRSGRALRLAQEVRRIEWQRTAGELGALLREARLVKELQPAYNRQLQRPEGLCGFIFDGVRLRLVGMAEVDGDALPAFLQSVRGLFRSRRAALAALRHLADEDGLCLQSLGFDTARKGPCFRHQIARCRGACAGKENPHFHLARVAAALARFPGAAQWPHAGPVGIVERHRDEEESQSDVHVVDRWCYLGTATSDAEVEELLASSRRAPFDYDQYRILARHLGKRGVRTVALHA